MSSETYGPLWDHLKAIFVKSARKEGNESILHLPLILFVALMLLPAYMFELIYKAGVKSGIRSRVKNEKEGVGNIKTKDYNERAADN